MSYITFHTKNSTIYESCVWIIDATRHICLTYIYTGGMVQYAASVLNTNGEEPTDDQYTNHELTTTRRYELRPIHTNIGVGLNYQDMLKAIRREMCHGQGCSGIRHPIERDNDSLSSVEMYSDTSDIEIPYIVSPQTFKLKQINQYCINIFCEEKHGDAPYTIRNIFLSYKGMYKNGDLLYGACISHSPAYSKVEYEYPTIDEEGHYETSLMRLEKCPVHMNVPNEFRHQLKTNTKHREDIIYLIIDKLQKRINGNMQIRGSKLDYWTSQLW